MIDFDEEEHNSGYNIRNKKTSRAKSLQELQQRLEAVTCKKKLTYKEKLTKKGLKNRMKKKNKQVERCAKQKLARAAKLTPKTEIKGEEGKNQPSIEPVFCENKMVFSKVDFANFSKNRNKEEKDPTKLLKRLKEQKEKFQKLEESGDTRKAIEIKEKTAWKNVLAKAEGKKIKDDPILLNKSIQKKDQQKRSSKKKWENRIQKEQKSKEEQQQMRKENITKRKKEKRNKRLKTASKKGRIIPGF